MTFGIELGAYAENENFLCLGGDEPHIRSQNIVFYSDSSRWHIKVTFKGNTIIGDVGDAFIEAQKNYSIRRQQLRAFISFIKFECLPLLEDTVTEVEFGPIPVTPETLPLSSKINELPVENGYHQFLDNLYYQIREDPFRTQYPSFVRDPSVSITARAGIKTITKIAPGISRVNVSSDSKRCYIFKSIDKPFYEPRDTKILEQELQNLKLFRQSTTIVQLVSVVISTNPYHTGRLEDPSPVLRGFLLEYHPGGTLQDALRENCVPPGSGRWPAQIGCGLEQLHLNYIAHMDLKPSNIVISVNGNAVIIDISGSAATKDWLAPEMREMHDPISLPWEARRRNDIWAYGTLLSMMVQFESDEEKARLLREVAEETRMEEPSERTELCYVVRKLRQNLS
jgi:serine/threonine protein kinase